MKILQHIYLAVLLWQGTMEFPSHCIDTRIGLPLCRYLHELHLKTDMLYTWMGNLKKEKLLRCTFLSTYQWLSWSCSSHQLLLLEIWGLAPPSEKTSGLPPCPAQLMHPTNSLNAVQYADASCFFYLTCPLWAPSRRCKMNIKILSAKWLPFAILSWPQCVNENLYREP